MTRDFVDAILEHIGSESVTDDEFASLDAFADEYTAITYQAIRDMLTAREAVSWQLRKLKLYYVSRGVSLSGTTEYVPRSQIFIGVPLD